jgi:hypothetical protein
MPYSIHEHTHRFAAWAASTAARASAECRFTVSVGTAILEDSPLYEVISNPDLLPDPIDFDASHRRWRRDIIRISGALDFTDGVAAKLINCYLKAALINPNTVQNPKIKAIHPPVDRILLKNLIKDSSLKFCAKHGISKKVPAWSKLKSDEYENIIEGIKEVLEYDVTFPRRGLWEIERWWMIK